MKSNLKRAKSSRIAFRSFLFHPSFRPFQFFQFFQFFRPFSSLRFFPSAWTALFLGFFLFLTGCAGPAQLANQTFVFELGKDVYGNPSLYIKNADQFRTERMRVESRSAGISMTDNRFVTVAMDYLGVGEYDFVLINGSQELPFVIKIKDTQPPNCASSPSSVTVKYGQPIDWASIFQASDLSGVYYDAPAGLSETYGDNQVSVKISDRFGNSTDKTITVQVVS